MITKMCSVSIGQEPLDPPIGRSTEESNIIFSHNEPVISASNDKELSHTVEAI